MCLNTLHSPQFLAELRQQMLGFAILQMGCSSSAEDAVQEAMLSAHVHAASFKGQSAYKTWVFAILKHKMIDQMRSKQRHPQTSQPPEHALNDATFQPEQLFDGSGHWTASHAPMRWPNPEGEVENDDFWQIFELCLTHLPAQHARVFMMREMLELETIEICAELDLSVSNLNVLMYRARLRLRECLESKWLKQEDCAC